jgi:hypothetical protein
MGDMEMEGLIFDTENTELGHRVLGELNDFVAGLRQGGELFF